jgi:hypothetical protein
VTLPEGEDLNESLAVNSVYSELKDREMDELEKKNSQRVWD